MRSVNAREIALQVALRVDRQDAYLNVALAHLLAQAGQIDRRDAGLASELSYGVFRRQLALDAAIQAHSDRPMKKLEAAVLAVLRLGAYQLLYLDKVPERAAVAETVELVKAHSPKSTGFVNAVLRALSRERTVPLPDPVKDLVGHLSIRESHPKWLVERWVKQLGPERAEALLVAHNRTPRVAVRVHAKKAKREDVQAQLASAGIQSRFTPYSPVGLILDEPGPLEKLQPFQQGLIQVQDEAAQAVGFWARPAGHQRLLDTCAAPGGKTCHVLERMEPGATMLALDVHAHKLGRITGEAKRLGVDGALTVLAHDAATPLPGNPTFDGVLCDAPCTGLGTLRRHPELRYRRQPEDIARLAVLQSQILAQTAREVAPGGLLTYAICSVTDEEGVQQVERFLAANPNFERVPGTDLPASLQPLTTPVGDLQTWPDLHDLDGFYAATVRRTK